MAEKFLSWDAEITQDSPEFILLPEGDYTFMVQGLEKSIYEGNSEKIGLFVLPFYRSEVSRQVLQDGLE